MASGILQQPKLPTAAELPTEAGKNDFSPRIRLLITLLSLAMNGAQLYWAHQIQVDAQKQIVEAADKAAKETEARRIAEQHAQAEQLVQQFWPSLSRGSRKERALAIAAIKTLWFELGEKLEKAAGSAHSISIQAPPAVPPANGQGAAVSPSHGSEPAGALVAEAETLAGFGLEASADRAYVDAGRALGLEASSSAALFNRARADYDAGRFHEALQKFQRLFGSSKK